jgi:polyketide synthase 12/myxalamid-type polyketide synthase MxaF
MFAPVVKGLMAEGHTVYVEMSPHPLLLPSVEEILGAEGRAGVAIGSLRRNQNERQTLLEGLGTLWVNGFPVAWDRQFPAGARRVRLPTYRWDDRERHWLEVPERAVRRGHPLLGESTPSSLSEGVTYWTNELSLRSVKYLDDHRVGGQPVFPAAGYVEMALEAGAQELGGQVELQDLEIEEALLLAGDEKRTVQLALRREGDQAARWQIASQAQGSARKWTVHARGRIARRELDLQPASAEGPEALAQRAQAESWDAFDGALLYGKLLAGGLDYGETFRGIQRGWRRQGEALVELACAGDVAKTDAAYRIHPGLLDAALQAIAAALGDGEDGLFLPAGMGRIQIARPRQGWTQQGKLWSYARCVREGDQLKSDVWIHGGSGEVLARVADFRARRVRGAGATGDESARWIFEVPWEELGTAPVAGGVGGDRRNWLVLSDSQGAMRPLVDALVARGSQVFVLARGDTYGADVAAGRITIDPQDASHYVRALQDLPASVRAQGWGILHGWSLDDALEEQAEVVEAGRGWRSLLRMTQALAGREAADRPRLVVVTRGARSVLPEDRLTGLAQTPVIGMCKTLVQEHPELSCLCVDLGEASGGGLAEVDVATLAKELEVRRREEELAIRGGRLFVPRLARSAPRPDESISEEPSFGPIDPEAIYLVTGGLGGLGLALARWLAGHGARHLALMGRRTPGEAAQKVIEVLRGAGVEVLPLQADVADRDGLRTAIAGLASSGRPIRGVFHLAGALDNAVLAALTPERFAQVLAPKIQGTWNLFRATRDQQLDHFVLFSSVASVFGAPGQANHAAANAFLDGFAAFRTARGGRTLSVNWGAWAEAGEAAQGRAAAYVASRGLQAMSSDGALRAFARVSSRGMTQAAVVAFDRSGPAESGILERPLFARLAAELGARSTRSGAEVVLTRQAVLAAAPGQRDRLVAQYLRDLVATQTGFAKSKIDIQRPLTSLGLDSLMTLKLKNRIETGLGVSIPATAFLQGITTAQLAARIVGMLAGADASTAAPADAADSANPATPTEPAQPSAATSRAAQRRAAHARRTGSN